MNVSALLVLLGLMKTLCSSPVCPKGCTNTNRHHQQHFAHLPDLQNRSVAPWKLKFDSVENREPSSIEYAVCTSCTVPDMVAMPIHINILVYERLETANCTHWCKCPYLLAVGCTCVNKQSQ